MRCSHKHGQMIGTYQPMINLSTNQRLHEENTPLHKTGPDNNFPFRRRVYVRYLSTTRRNLQKQERATQIPIFVDPSMLEYMVEQD